jgi:hypothetical protein
MSALATRTRAVVLLRGPVLLDPETLEPLAELDALGVWRTPDGIEIDALEKAVSPVRAQVTSAALRAHHEAMDAAWLAESLPILRTIAERQPTLTTDDVWTAILSPPRDPRTGMSMLMRTAARMGLIAQTEKTQQTIRQTSGGRRVRIWRSLVCDPR